MSNDIIRAKAKKILATLDFESLENNNVHEWVNSYFQLSRTSRELNELGQEVVPVLIQLEKNLTKSQIDCAIRTMGEFKAPEAADFILRHCEDSSNGVRKSALWALGEFRCSEHYPVFEKALSDSDFMVRSAAIDAIGKLPGIPNEDEFVELLNSDDYEVRAGVIKKLADENVKIPVNSLVKVIKDHYESVREAAIDYIIAENDEDNIPLAIIVLGDETKKIAKKAYTWLEPRVEQILPVMVEKLDGEGRFTRELAARMLGKSKNKSVIAPIGEALKATRSATFAKEAVKSLISFKEPEIIDYLGDALKYNEKTTEPILKYFSKKRPEKAFSYLIYVIRQSVSFERLQYKGIETPIEIINKYPPEKLIPELRKLLDHSAPSILAEVIEKLIEHEELDCLNEIESAYEKMSAEDFSDSEMYGLNSAISSYRSAIKPVAMSMEIQLQYNDDSVVLDALESITDEQIQENLIQIVELLESKNSKISRKAVKVLDNSPSVNAEEILIKLLSSKIYFSGCVFDAVDEIASSNMIEILLSHIKHNSIRERKKIAKILERLEVDQEVIEKKLIQAEIIELIRSRNMNKIDSMGQIGIEALVDIYEEFEGDWVFAYHYLTRKEILPESVYWIIAQVLLSDSTVEAAPLRDDFLPILGKLLLKDFNQIDAQKCLDWLLRYGDKCKKYLKAALPNSNNNGASVVEVFYENGFCNYEELIEMLDSSNAEERVSALKLMALLKDERAVPVCIDILSDETTKYSNAELEAAALVLGVNPKKEAVPVLISALHRSIQNAANALVEIGNKEAELGLIGCLRKQSGRLAATALNNLNWIPTNELDKAYFNYYQRKFDAFSDDLENALIVTESILEFDSYPDRNLIGLISKSKDPMVIPTLIRFLYSSYDARKNAEAELIEFGPCVIDELLKNDVGAEAAKVYQKYPDVRAEGILLKMLESGREVVIAVETLGKIKSNKAFEPIMKKLDTTDQVLKRRIVEALARINNPTAISPLQNLLSECDKKLKPVIEKTINKLEKTKSKLDLV